MSNIKYLILICCLAYLSSLNCQNQTTVPSISINGKLNGDICQRNEECISKNCLKSRCKPVQCRNDKTCIEHGLRDFYCSDRSTLIPSFFASECIPKRGFF